MLLDYERNEECVSFTNVFDFLNFKTFQVSMQKIKLIGQND